MKRKMKRGRYPFREAYWVTAQKRALAVVDTGTQQPDPSVGDIEGRKQRGRAVAL
jgi:hypothetical protein